MSIIIGFLFINLCGIVGSAVFGSALVVVPRRFSRLLNDTLAVPVIGSDDLVKNIAARLLGVAMIGVSVVLTGHVISRFT